MSGKIAGTVIWMPGAPRKCALEVAQMMRLCPAELTKRGWGVAAFRSGLCIPGSKGVVLSNLFPAAVVVETTLRN